MRAVRREHGSIPPALTTAAVETAVIPRPAEVDLRWHRPARRRRSGHRLAALGPTRAAGPGHDAGPTVDQSRPNDTLRNARTIAGSNCSPALAASPRRATGTLIGLLYEHAPVITSKESATLTMRAASEMTSRSSPFG
jgi:hypothetical protein